MRVLPAPWLASVDCLAVCYVGLCLLCWLVSTALGLMLPHALRRAFNRYWASHWLLPPGAVERVRLIRPVGGRGCAAVGAGQVHQKLPHNG